MEQNAAAASTGLGPAAVPALLALMRAGAYVRRRGFDGEVFSPRNHFANPVAVLIGTELETALALGWLVGAGPERFTLSRQGRAALGARRRSAARVALTASRPANIRHGATAALNPNESPLAWLRRRRDRDGRPLMSDAEFNAGERLRADFWFAQMTPRVTASWSGTATSRRERRAAPGSGVELSDNVIAARERVNRALVAVGPELAGILFDVCCELKGLEHAERAAGWPLRSGKVVLLLALARLARHYGLLPSARPGWSRPSRIQHWGAPGYRPDLDQWRSGGA